MVLRPITAMLIRQLNVVVMNALIGIDVIFILKGLVLSTLVLKI
jgi:IS30 family transposase